MNNFKLGAIVVAFSSLVAVSNATIFFDQLGTGGTAETSQNGFASQRFDPTYDATYSTDAIDNFATSQAWHLTNVSFGLVMFNNANATAAGITGWEFNIYSAAGGTTANEPLNGDVMHGVLGTGAASIGAVGFAGQAQGYLVSLDLTSLNINLNAGSYWIGVMAQNPYGANGQTGILGSTIDANGTGGDARQINPGAGFGLAGNNAPITGAINLSYQISGSAVPEPASLAVLGIGALALIRRRRSNKA